MQLVFFKKISSIILGASLLIFASCKDTSNTTQETTTSDSATGTDVASMNGDTSMHADNLMPKGPKPDWGMNIAPEMQVVMEKLMSYNSPPLITLSAAEARKQPSPATAVMDVMKDNNIPMPPSTLDTMGKTIPVSGGKIHLRIYSPKGEGPFPIIVYYHGGGWVIADLDTYDASARGLAEQTGAVLVSVAYRQAPEFKFPTAHNDSYAAYEWVLNNSVSIKGDVKHIAVVGESAGGNLAAAVSMMARNKGIAIPGYQLLVYPIAGYDTTTASYQKNANAKPLDRPLMGWFFSKYLKSPADGKNPLISLVSADLKGLPPTTIITAEYDPLLSDGELLAQKLKEAGVTVNLKNYNGVTHEFFGMATVVPAAKDAQAFAASELKNFFNK